MNQWKLIHWIWKLSYSLFRVVEWLLHVLHMRIICYNFLCYDTDIDLSIIRYRYSILVQLIIKFWNNRPLATNTLKFFPFFLRERKEYFAVFVISVDLDYRRVWTHMWQVAIYLVVRFMWYITNVYARLTTQMETWSCFVPAKRSERIADVILLHTIVHITTIVGGAHGCVEFHVMGLQITR